MQIAWTLETAQQCLREWINFEAEAYNRPLGRELLVKAFGRNPGVIWDLTLGFAEDAWTLVRLGYCVKGFERDDFLFECLKTAYQKLLMDPKWVTQMQRFEIHHADSWVWLQKHPEILIDSCYLDPMFFDKTSVQKISAQPRKPMQAMRYWLGQSTKQGNDPNLQQWIDFLYPRVRRRLVVKVHKSVIHQLPKPRFLVSGSKMQWMVYEK